MVTKEEIKSFLGQQIELKVYSGGVYLGRLNGKLRVDNLKDGEPNQVFWLYLGCNLPSREYLWFYVNPDNVTFCGEYWMYNL